MKIQFGIGRRCTTPQEPISLAGYFNKRVWDHVLDDLEVRAVVFKDGDKLSAILHFDIISINYKLYGAVREALTKAGLTQFDESNLLVAATHTHTAPDTYGQPNSQAYNEFAAARAAEALADAVNNIQDGELFGGMAADARFIFNRRYWMKAGHVITNPGKLNPDIMRPEGDIDPEIPMLAIKTSAGLKVLLASIVNHTDTIGGCGVSADWSGVVRRELEPEMAPGAMVITLIGTAGNINHFDVTTDMNQTNSNEPYRIGKGYAESIRKVWNDLTPVEGDGFRFASAEVESTPREIDAAELAEASEIMEKYADLDINACGDLTSEDLVKKTPVVLKYFAENLVTQANCKVNPRFRLTYLKFGDNTVIATLPSEPFVEIGLTLRKSVFAGKHCLVSSHGNYNGGGHYIGGYIPNPWNYGRGGYETTPRSNGYSIHTADRLIAAWRKLAEEL